MVPPPAVPPAARKKAPIVKRVSPFVSSSGIPDDVEGATTISPDERKRKVNEREKCRACSRERGDDCQSHAPGNNAPGDALRTAVVSRDDIPALLPPLVFAVPPCALPPLLPVLLVGDREEVEQYQGG